MPMTLRCYRGILPSDGGLERAKREGLHGLPRNSGETLALLVKEAFLVVKPLVAKNNKKMASSRTKMDKRHMKEEWRLHPSGNRVVLWFSLLAPRPRPLVSLFLPFPRRNLLFPMEIWWPAIRP